ncbi:hypothetical protein [Candidatus Pandoraea novymonadis]|uniref:DUF3318 domain-containing protein n=1 Tax=Candidatus Pandoraea novymonadis TaxID=1808959 RepID=A0ABX5FFI2_9BURK|nr:hypothetical protein [Candidatus Pandoraea novymonadis]PSB91802.1 hypothetical protein BZL35_00015 [Candidatus Pandoraea novymonadis]
MANNPNPANRSRTSRRELLAIRKEILLTRIAIERAELVLDACNTCNRLRGFRWLKLLLPRHFSPLASLALTGLSRKTPLGTTFQKLVKWSSLVFLAWQAVQFWQKTVTKNSTKK